MILTLTKNSCFFGSYSCYSRIFGLIRMRFEKLPRHRRMHSRPLKAAYAWIYFSSSSLCPLDAKTNRRLRRRARNLSIFPFKYSVEQFSFLPSFLSRSFSLVTDFCKICLRQQWRRIFSRTWSGIILLHFKETFATFCKSFKSNFAKISLAKNGSTLNSAEITSISFECKLVLNINFL